MNFGKLKEPHAAREPQFGHPGLLFHMTQLIKRSNTKRNRTTSKPAVSEHKLTVCDHYLLWQALAIHLLRYF